jgi:hypothetical protein
VHTALLAAGQELRRSVEQFRQREKLGDLRNAAAQPTPAQQCHLGEQR